MPYVTGTVTLEIAPIGDKLEIRMWIGRESVRASVFDFDSIQSARVNARTMRDELKRTIAADVVIVEQELPQPAAGPQPDMFPIKR
jgi:hypothetical protein